MRTRPAAAFESTALVIWPAAWIIGYYALTLWSVWGRPVHPIQAMFLMFGMLITGGLAVIAAYLWVRLLRRHVRGAATGAPTAWVQGALGAVSGAVLITVLVLLFQLLLLEDLGPLGVIGGVGAAGVAGAGSAFLTSAVECIRERVARARASATAESS